MCEDCTREEMNFLIAVLGAAVLGPLSPDQEMKRNLLRDLLVLSLPRHANLSDAEASAAADRVIARMATVNTKDIIALGQCCDELSDVLRALEQMVLALLGKRASQGDKEADAVVERANPVPMSFHVIDMNKLRRDRDRARQN